MYSEIFYRVYVTVPGAGPGTGTMAEAGGLFTIGPDGYATDGDACEAAADYVRQLRHIYNGELAVSMRQTVVTEVPVEGGPVTPPEHRKLSRATRAAAQMGEGLRTIKVTVPHPDPGRRPMVLHYATRKPVQRGTKITVPRFGWMGAGPDLTATVIDPDAHYGGKLVTV